MWNDGRLLFVYAQVLFANERHCSSTNLGYICITSATPLILNENYQIENIFVGKIAWVEL